MYFSLLVKKIFLIKKKLNYVGLLSPLPYSLSTVPLFSTNSSCKKAPSWLQNTSNRRSGISDSSRERYGSHW